MLRVIRSNKLVRRVSPFFMALALLAFMAVPAFAQASGPVGEFQSGAVSTAGLAAALVVAVVLILSAVSLALWGLRKAGAGK